jgi:hypothetical protein
MNNLENLLKETNLKIDESLSSVFTKDDVKTLLYTFAEQTKNQFDLEDQDYLEDRIRKALDDVDLIDYDSAEFTIEYNNALILQHVNLCEDDIVDAILDSLRKE